MIEILKNKGDKLKSYLSFLRSTNGDFPNFVYTWGWCGWSVNFLKGIHMDKIYGVLSMYV
mgnify:CR=1 FL=1